VLFCTPLLPPLHSASRLSPLPCTQQFNGCSWQGTRLVVGRAKEAFQQRLNRERQAAQHAAAATAAALEERRRQIAAAPVDVAELDRQLQNTELWLRGPGGKVRVTSSLIISCAVLTCQLTGDALHFPFRAQWVSVGACGGLGSHKRSFQRYQPDAAAGAPDTGLGRHASFRAAAQTAGVASDDPWARLFRKASVLDDIDDQPDDADFLDPEDQAEDDVREEQEPTGRKEAAVEPPAAVEAKPMPPQRSVAAAREKASAAPEAKPRRAARQLAEAPVSKPGAASAPPEKPHTMQAAPVEAYTAQARDDAVAGERAQQLALLARLGFGGDADEKADTAAPRVVAASRVARPVAHGFSSSSEEGAGEPAAEHGTGEVQSQEEEEVMPKAVAPQQAQKAAKPRRTPQPRAAPVVLADDAAWDRALRLAAGEDVEDEAAPQEDPPPAAEPPRKRRRSRVKQAAAPGEEGDAAAAPAASGPEEEARAARVRQALAATRLGEGRAGVYFADTAFDWRSLAVEAGQQTWSLLGGAAEGGASMLPAAVHAVDVEPMPMQAPPAAAVPPPAQAFKPVDLAALGVSFARRADGAGDAKAAWQAQRDVLWADVKRKKREVKRKR
jgi:hypothetical protein